VFALLPQIIVPTADTVRYTFLIDNLLAAGKHVLCVGETGTGKTLNVSNKLLNSMPEEVRGMQGKRLELQRCWTHSASCCAACFWRRGGRGRS